MSCALKSKLVDQLGEEDGEVRGPLAGLFPANLPQLPLEDALLPIAFDCPNCHPKTGSCLKLAKKKAKKVQKKYKELSLDECTSIVLYTMEDTPRETSLYIKMNEALRAKDRSKVRPWRDFMWILLQGLRKLPAMPLGVLVRGCKKNPEDLNLCLDIGEEITWSAFTSTATSVDVMNNFLGDDGPRTLLQIELTEPVARSIQEFSLFPAENEVLLPPNVCLEFVSKFNAGHGLVMMQFKQIESVDALLDMSKIAENDVPCVGKESAEPFSSPAAESKPKSVSGTPEKTMPNTATSSAALVSPELPGESSDLADDGELKKESALVEGLDAHSKKRPRVQIEMPADMEAMRELLTSGEIAKLPVSMMKEWLRSQGWTTSGKRNDIVERIRAASAQK